MKTRSIRADRTTAARQAAIWAAAFLVGSCSGSTATDAVTLGDVASIEVTPSTSALALGAQLPLTAVARDVDGKIVSNASIVWSVKDPNIATVSPIGVVTGEALGTTQIAASANGKSGIAAITVLKTPVASVVTNSIPVGSLPWGLAIGNHTDTLLVANSGGTNISRVYIGSTDPTALHEDLGHRILTRNTYVYTLHVKFDVTQNKTTMQVEGPVSYSDRPQYLVQSAGGRIFYSTRPTASAPASTIRWLDPSLPVPDPHQIWQYGNIVSSTEQTYALLNVDSVALGLASANTGASDTLFLWDHPYGQKTGTIAVSGTDPLKVISDAVAAGSDAEAVLRLDVASLALSDTTFAAVSGNRHWVGFGEGHSSGAGRIILVADSSGVMPNFYSPLVTITDLTDNASEPVFGLAMDQNGLTVAAHGNQSYFAAVEDPFHLRLQGKFDSFDNGAGITFHPLANGALTPQDQRLAFVAAASGQIEVVDIAYYTNRARLQLKTPIYGPIRASLPMPGDAPDVILKLFAMSQNGLIVIDLSSRDIKPGP